MLLVDMSAVTFVDPASTKALLTLDNDLKSRKVSLCLAKCSGIYPRLLVSICSLTLCVTVTQCIHTRR